MEAMSPFFFSFFLYMESMIVLYFADFPHNNHMLLSGLIVIWPFYLVFSSGLLEMLLTLYHQMGYYFG